MRETGVLVLTAFLAIALTAADVHAVSGDAGQAATSDSSSETQAHSADATAVTSPVRIEHHASFRLRSDILLGGDLGNTSSAIPVPFATDGEPSHTLAWTSIRLRYDAAVHVGEPWTIHVGLDALDNVVLGSTFAGAGSSFEEGLWQDAQVSPVAGISGFSDALEVRHLYGTWRLLEFIDLSGGRMPDNRGLGMWRQAGLCPDCNYGTYVDGAQLGVDIFGFRIEVGWEASAIGVTSEMPGMPGQPTNFDLSDDVNTWTLSLGHSALPVGIAPSAPVDETKPGWAFDWSVHAALTSQSMDTAEQDLSDLGSECAQLAGGTDALLSLPYECWRLMPRDAALYRPGGWVQVVWRRSALSSLRLEFELSALIGEIENTQNDPAYQDSAKSLAGVGGAFELEYRDDRLQTGLDVGFATGDDGDYLGVSDGQNVSVADELYLDDSSTAVRENETISSFWFHRDYHIDLLLFRQVIGTVTNAVYVRPWVAYTLLDTEAVEIGARFDALYAAAMNPEGTPGKGDHWGVEFDASAWVNLPHGFGMSLHTGVLLPLDALNDRVTGASPSPAFAARGLFYWRY
ncbi:MAG: hypothetical protein ACPGU1_08530 [Myxococcota bacterium]